MILQPDKPLMVMEYWTGWFRHWNEPRPELSLSPQQAAENLRTILSLKSSFNLYMFHGGYCVVGFNFFNVQVSCCLRWY